MVKKTVKKAASKKTAKTTVWSVNTATSAEKRCWNWRNPSWKSSTWRAWWSRTIWPTPSVTATAWSWWWTEILSWTSPARRSWTRSRRRYGKCPPRGSSPCSRFSCMKGSSLAVFPPTDSSRTLLTLPVFEKGSVPLSPFSF